MGTSTPKVTLATVAPAVSTFYDRNLLENARALLAHEKWGQVRTLPEGSGTIIKFRRPNVLAVATVPLQEGVTPTGSAFTYTSLTATPLQYGDYVTFSDRVNLQNQDAVLTDISNEQGYQAGLTVDTLRRDVLVGGTSVFYANGSARTDVNTIIATDDLEKVIRYLKQNNAMKITKMITAGRGISTEPILPCFIGLIHPNVAYTVRGFTKWIEVQKYASQTTVMEGEIGSYMDIRFIETTQAKEWSGGGAAGGSSVEETGGVADVYGTLILGANAYGIVPVSGMALRFIVKQLGSAGAADALEQRGSAGWKMMTTTKILNDLFMTRIESAVSA
jgi:N4-gp56 family major capsid protein